MDSQTYSAFLEEAEILAPITDMEEQPVRYYFRAPSRSFFCVIALSQVTLLSTVVAIVLIVTRYQTMDVKERRGYIAWLVFSICATFFFALTTVLFWHQRRRMRYMQSRLKAMQLTAEAHSSQKKIDTASKIPQLRTETDHRQSMLAQQSQRNVAINLAANTTSTSTIRGGRERHMSSAAGEGCELSLFQTHLSNGSMPEGGEQPPTINSPPPVYTSPHFPLNHVQQLQRDSTTSTNIFQDDPAMHDLLRGLYVGSPRHDDRPSSLILTLPSPLRHSQGRSTITTTANEPPPSPTTLTVAVSRRHSRIATTSSPAPANRSSAALPTSFPNSEGGTSVNTHASPSPVYAPASSSDITPSSSPECYGAILPSFPLPPTHARFSDPPQTARSPCDPRRWSRERTSSLLRREKLASRAAELSEEEREVWGRMAAVGDLQTSDERAGAGGNELAAPVGADRRDSHVEGDRVGGGDGPQTPDNDGKLDGPPSRGRADSDVLGATLPRKWRTGSIAGRENQRRDGEEVEISRQAGRGLASLASSIGEAYARMDEERTMGRR